MSDKTSYRHVQFAELCLLLYLLAVIFLVLGLVLKNEPPILWLFLPIGLLMLLLAASFHQLTVEGQTDQLCVRYGPIPLFRRTIRYEHIDSAEIGRITIQDGWGIRTSLPGGWVWNLWGRDCVVLQLKNGVLRIESDDAQNLADFLKQKIGTQHKP